MNNTNIIIVEDESTAREALNFLLDCSLIANDIETLPQQMLMTVNGYSGITDAGEVRDYVFPMYRGRDPLAGINPNHEHNYHVMREVNASSIPFTFHNGSYDLFWLTRYRLPVANYAYDSMTMFWALYPELPKRLDFISSILLDDYVYWKGDAKNLPWRDYLVYNGRDCNRTLLNTRKLVTRLSDNKAARRNFSDAHRRVISCIMMSLQGLRIDESARIKLGLQLSADAEAADERFKYLVADPEFNFRSPKQLKELFYVMLGATPRDARGRITKYLAKASTGKLPLASVKHEHPIFRTLVTALQDAITPAKQISNVINMKVAPWGRCYTGYNGVGTTTTRLSSSSAPIDVGSNLQNIRKSYRHWLVADKGCFLFEVDFSAADDVFISFESGDKNKIKLFRSGKDMHSANVALLFPHWTYEAVVAGKQAGDPRVVDPVIGVRQGIKRVAHGCNYLMSAYTLLLSIGRESVVAAARELGNAEAGSWNTKQLTEFCGLLENKYRAHYARLSRPFTKGSWYTELHDELCTTGGFTTAFNYYQRFLGDPNDHAVLRAVTATVGQANTAGRVNMAVDELNHGFIMGNFRDAKNPASESRPRLISQALNGANMVLQTHDSLTFNVNPRHPKWHEAIENILHVMHREVIIRNSQTAELESFRLGVDAELGFGWGKSLVGLDKPTLTDVIQTLDHITLARNSKTG